MIHIITYFCSSEYVETIEIVIHGGIPSNDIDAIEYVVNSLCCNRKIIFTKFGELKLYEVFN